MNRQKLYCVSYSWKDKNSNNNGFGDTFHYAKKMNYDEIQKIKNDIIEMNKKEYKFDVYVVILNIIKLGNKS